MNTGRTAYGQCQGDVVTLPSTFADGRPMNIRPAHSLILAVALACASGAVFAADTPPAPMPATAATAPQAPETVASILATQHGLRERLEKHTGEYARFDDNAIRKMQRAQDRIFQMLSGVSSLEQLNPAQRVDLSNALDEVKAVLLANENQRMICHLERRTGSNMITRRCETVEQREANAREANRQIFHDGIGR